ncbi:MAG: MAPEG family protein [Reyranella sp.]|uniref:MAPEG family protein n=1 Tax=Reyranella sp. TaxID=1929291 RepID=UPI001AD23938|nr:MAPEG family protein [Reyranella sp.]MBN9091516.1 MAPEG family protein [Reyranella sp.]
MGPELKYLLFSVLLTFVQVLIAAAAANQVVGLTTLAGNRDDMPTYTGFAGRAKRAHLNMLENMALFSALVLIAVVAQKTNATTAMGALIFFWARLIYAVIYLLGVPWLRTLAWFVSVIGMVMVAWPLFA